MEKPTTQTSGVADAEPPTPHLCSSVLSGDAVSIVAPARARRPHSLGRTENAAPPCPFCPENAHLTPPDLIRKPTEGDWQIRVFENLFPLASEAYGEAEHATSPLHYVRPNIGRHEVVVETRAHEADLATLPLGHLAQIVSTWRERIAALSSLPSTRAVVLFKNVGTEAGGTLRHPHSQIVSLDSVPPELTDRMRAACSWFTKHGTAAQNAAVGQALEGDAGPLLTVHTGARHLLVKPTVSRQDWELQLVPSQGCGRFLSISNDEAYDLSILLQDALQRLDAVLGPYSYNLMLIEPASWDPILETAMPWRLDILPRTSSWTGFEFATGIATNTVAPATAVARLRSAKPATA